MLTYEQAKALPVIATCTRPDGYNGRRVTVTLHLYGQYVIELHQHGFHRCPALPTAASAEEVNWMIDHKPSFRNYRRV